MRVNLFQKFQVYNEDLLLDCFNPTRVQELFSFLLLQRHRPHRREALIEILWGEKIPRQAKKYLRQLIWQLRAGLQTLVKAAEYDILVADEEWISLHPQANILLDVDEFEQAYLLTRDVDGASLTSLQVQTLQNAVQLYTGDLLEGWYQEWCLFERERLQNIYLLMLDKLMKYAESKAMFETGIHYGMQALRCDGAREITYRRLMRMCSLAGNRTGALRYYNRCVESLRAELEVEPTRKTRTLWQEICADQYPPAAVTAHRKISKAKTSAKPQNLDHLLDSCRALNHALAEAQEYNQQNIQLLVSHMPAYHTDIGS